jgi:hypothetical protein
MSSRNARWSCAAAWSKRRSGGTAFDGAVVTRRDDPVPLRDAVTKVGEELGLSAPGVVATLTARWSEIVGPAIAAHATVRSVRDGECTIVVDGPVWATQLRYATSDLLARANEHCGEGSVTSVKVLVATPRETR